MAQVKVYTTAYCPFCVQAKRLLDSEKIEFEEINLEGKWDELDALKAKTGMRTVPQIFINDELIGGFQELSGLRSSGELHSKLK